MKNNFVKIFSFIVICQMFFLSMPFKAEAGIPATIIADIPATMQWIKEFMEKMAFAAAKKGAIQGVISGVSSAIGNGSDGPMFITDWRDAIEKQPEKATTIQMQNLFTSMGEGVGTNYVATDGSAGYVSGMLSGAQESVLDMSIPQVINMAEYGVNDPSEVFNGNNMRAFLTAFGSTSKIGNRMEATLYAQDQKNKFDEINRRIAEAQAIANNGYYPKMSGGAVITPGASIRDLMASAQNASFISLAAATTIQEVTAALVSRTVSTTLKKGISSVKKEYGSEINSASSTYAEYKDLKGSFGSLETKK